MADGATHQERMFDEMQEALDQKTMLVERLVKRVVSKDEEFALERQAWKRKDRERESRIRDLEKQLREVRCGA